MKKQDPICWWFDMALVVARVAGELTGDLLWVATTVEIVHIVWTLCQPSQWPRAGGRVGDQARGTGIRVGERRRCSDRRHRPSRRQRPRGVGDAGR